MKIDLETLLLLLFFAVVDAFFSVYWNCYTCTHSKHSKDSLMVDEFQVSNKLQSRVNKNPTYLKKTLTLVIFTSQKLILKYCLTIYIYDIENSETEQKR